MKTKPTLAALSVAALTMAGAASAYGQEDDKWHFGVNVPLWAPQIDGNVTVKGHQENTHISFQDLKDHLDASFAIGLEARKEKLGIFTGFSYMKFSVGDRGVEDILKIYIVNAGLSYQLIKTEGEHPFVLAGTAGLRYWRAENDLTLRDPGGNLLFNGSKDKDIYDPVIGMRGSQYLTRKFHLDFAGDVGGFGFTDSQATLDWSATGVASYDFCKFFTLSAGYQALAIDASKGSGASKNGIDLIFHGILIVAKFKF